jgi:hypothetical protein
MPMSDVLNDPIVGKVVIDFSRKYVWIYLCEGDGTIKDFEHVRWPFRLDTEDAGRNAGTCLISCTSGHSTTS